MTMRILAAAIAVAALSGCVREVIEPRMFEPAYAPNRHVDVYYTEEGVAEGGTQIGQLTLDTSRGWAVDMAYKRLLDTARARGADVLVISGLTESQVEGALSVSGAKRLIEADSVSGRMIRYAE